jgi:hypothetical protein
MLGGRRRWVYALEYAVALMPCLAFGVVAFRPGLTLGLVLEIAALSLVDYNLRANRHFSGPGRLAGQAQREPGAAGTAWRFSLAARPKRLSGGAACGASGPCWPRIRGRAGLFGAPGGRYVAVSGCAWQRRAFTSTANRGTCCTCLPSGTRISWPVSSETSTCCAGVLPALVVLHAVRHPDALLLLGYAVTLTSSVSQALAVVLKYARYAPAATQPQLLPAGPGAARLALPTWLPCRGARGGVLPKP